MKNTRPPLTVTLQTVMMLIILTFTAPTTALAEGFWTKYFPEIFNIDTYEGPDPAKTLIAPFADKPSMDKKNPKNSWQSLESTKTLDKSHRSKNDISDWLIATISEIMTFPTNKYTQEIQKKSHYFNKTGWNQYTEFLENSNIKNAITSNQYVLNTIVNKTPVILNKGVLDSRYKWLYEIEAIITYQATDIQNYTKLETFSQRLKIKTQVGRYNATQNPHNILIEQWTSDILPMDTQK